MSEAKHTPGPWYVAYHDDEPAIEICRKWDETVRPGSTDTFGSCYGAHIARIKYTTTGVPTKAQAEANARVIIAAPRLLDALKFAAIVVNGISRGTLPACFRPDDQMVADMNEVIAQAEGKL